MPVANRRYRTVVAPVLALVLVLAGAPPSQARRVGTGSEVQVHQTTDGLTIADPALHMTVQISSTPLQIRVLGAGARTLIGGVAGLDSLLFGLDRSALTRLLPGRHIPGSAGSPVTVRVVRLLRWTALADGASLVAATDDPLGRAARIAVHIPAPGVAVFDAQLTDDRAIVSAGLAVPSGSDEHFFGLGEQFGGVDQRGRRVGVLVQDGMTTIRPRGGYAPAPFFVSTRGYGFYLAGALPSQFTLDVPPETSAWRVTAQSSSLTWYVLDGPLPADVLARYSDLTGHPPMPPPWTLGVWKTAIGGEARVMAESQRLRRMHIPVSVIWTYDAVDEAVKLGWPYPNFARIPPGPYPDLPGFTAALHREGFQVLGYLAPEFTRSRPGFTYPAKHRYFVRSSGGHIYLLDLTNPAALAWWEGNERRILTTLGFDGWLLDLGDRLPQGARFFNGLAADEMANRYPLLLAQAAEQVGRAVKPNALFVMRSGFSGIQSLQPAVWAGDQRANWSPTQGLPAAISAGLSWGISGAPFWGSDIGGYLDGGVPQARQEELWMRWLEFGAFSPIMRDQLGNKGYGAIYLWSNARTESAFRFYAQLHQSLFPYLYAAARVAHLTGLPIMRHLFLAYPRDPHVYGLNDEYLLGPDLLVAPVIKPGVTAGLVYLPTGNWVDYWTGAVLAGGRVVSAAAPLDRIPLFVRGGALLPTLAISGDTLAPGTDPTVRPAGDDLVLHLYPGGAGEQTILADGTVLAAQLDARETRLRIAGPTRRYRVTLPLALAPRDVQLDGHALQAGRAGSAPAWRYDAGARLLQLDLRPARGAIVVTVAQ
jgi:alpha-D-xyloside xylohydrolase